MEIGHIPDVHLSQHEIVLRLFLLLCPVCTASDDKQVDYVSRVFHV